MLMRELKWSKSEKDVARQAFDKAYLKECQAIVNRAKSMIAKISNPREIWKVEDYLFDERKQTDEKYNFRRSMLPLVFTRLIEEGWLKEADLKGLGEDKLQMIRKGLQINRS
jgi:photoprotection regulator FRP-like protein